MLSLIGSLYAIAATLAAPFLRVHLRRRARRGREIATRLPERRGIERSARPVGPLIWMHAASIGETVSILPVLTSLSERAPGMHVLLTTGTVTSARLLADRLSGLRLHETVQHRFVPLDVPAWVGRFLDHWRPDAGGFVESEIWPNLLAAARARRIPLMLVNARLSERSFRRWSWVRRFARTQFGGFDVVQAQGRGDAVRLRALGARRVSARGNLKSAADTLPFDEAERVRLAALLDGRPVWLAASTHPGEEIAVLAAHAALLPAHPRVLTIIVPRHPARGEAVAGLCAPAPVTRRSLGQDPPEGAGIWVADTLGELGLLYRLAEIAFVGGSLVPHGGQNVLEAARLGCAVAVGPHTDNFTDAVARLEEAGGLTAVANAWELARWVAAMLDAPDRRAAAAEAASAAACPREDLPGQVAGALLELATRPATRT